MQSLRLFTALAMATAFVSGPAFAGAPDTFHGKATLAGPAATKEATISGVAWRCEGAECSGNADRYSSLDSRMKECRKVVAVLGPVTAYQSHGVEMSRGDLAVCNKAAPAVQTAQTPAPNGAN